MWRKSLLFGTALSMSLFAAGAQAEHDRRGRDRDRDRDVDYARVVDVDPIVRRIRVTTPRRECWDEIRYDDDYYGDRRDRYAGNGVGGMIVGGIIGGAIGSTVGRGDGRRIATAAGALIGSAIGNDVAQRGRYGRDRYYGRDAGRSVERCETREEESWEERVDGYDVTYEYAGRRYRTRMPYDPGDRVRIEVDVRPT
jgi:uncharacterized protein YcfJ